MVDVVTFAQALDAAPAKRHLLLGNGFSIALKPNIFSYASLYQRADFAKVPYAGAIFEALGTKDFEAVIKVLVSAHKVLKIYDGIHILVTAIGQNHPDRPFEVEPEQFAACRGFLANFGHVYTLNYDILLYWALMQDKVDDLRLKPDDGFRQPEDQEDASYVSWLEAQTATVHFLHGALHLFDDGDQIIKYTWSRTDIPLLEQIRDALDHDRYPLFVSEGTSRHKLEKILHNAYLHKGLRSFEAICDMQAVGLFIFGHSLAANDDHILRKISRGNVSKLYVSLFGDPASAENKLIISNAQALVAKRKTLKPKRELELCFYSAASAQIWG